MLSGRFSATRRRWRRLRLRPWAGRILPRDLRPKNVHRLAEALPGGVSDPDFTRLVRRINGSPLYQANQVEVFFHGSEAFAAMIEAIGQAVGEICFETYILRDDSTGRAVAEALRQAAARGVRVLVLADAYGSWRAGRKFWRRLRVRNIQTRLFHPLSGRIRRHIFRNHRKILVVDRRIAFTGGMNVGNEYGSLRRSKGAFWRDVHVRIEGPAASEMAGVFAEGWHRSGGLGPAIPIPPPAAPTGASLYVIDWRPGRGTNEALALFAAIAGAARRRLWVTSSYFAPPKIIIDSLCRAARRGVDVRLLLQGQSDVPIVRHAGHGSFARLLRSGVRIFEYDAAILHAKTVVADDHLSIIGSANLDYRSFYLNAECYALILHSPTAARLSHAFEEDLTRSREIGRNEWRSRSLLHRLGDGCALLLSPFL